MGKEHGKLFRPSLAVCRQQEERRLQGGRSEQRHRHRAATGQHDADAAFAPELGPGQLFLSWPHTLAGNFLEAIVIFQPVPSRPSWNPSDQEERPHLHNESAVASEVFAFWFGGLFFVVNQKSLALKFIHPK